MLNEVHVVFQQTLDGVKCVGVFESFDDAFSFVFNSGASVTHEIHTIPFTRTKTQ